MSMFEFLSSNRVVRRILQRFSKNVISELFRYSISYNALCTSLASPGLLNTRLLNYFGYNFKT